jgi:NAD(P)-dependent dehydrogenase (short-subunit alcohol dehydrogenase family)
MGSISISRQLVYPARAAYKISKTALNHLTVEYSHQLEKDGLTFIAISPGWLKTDLGTSAAPLEVEVGTAGTLEVIEKATFADNGKFFNVSLF